jgi:hypothetical protein
MWLAHFVGDVAVEWAEMGMVNWCVGSELALGRRELD